MSDAALARVPDNGADKHRRPLPRRNYDQACPAPLLRTSANLSRRPFLPFVFARDGAVERRSGARNRAGSANGVLVLFLGGAYERQRKITGLRQKFSDLAAMGQRRACALQRCRVRYDNVSGLGPVVI